MARQHRPFLAGGQVPQPDGLVLRPRGQGPAVRGKAHAGHRIRIMAPQHRLFLAGGQVDGGVMRHRGQGPAVRGKAHAGNPSPSRIAPEHHLFLARRQVPQPDGLVQRPRGQGPAVRGKAHAGYLLRMARQHRLFLACRQVPQPDGVPRPRGQGPAVRGKAHTPVGANVGDKRRGIDRISENGDGGTFRTGPLRVEVRQGMVGIQPGLVEMAISQ